MDGHLQRTVHRNGRELEGPPPGGDWKARDGTSLDSAYVSAVVMIRRNRA
jgi:hypothetical protein